MCVRGETGIYKTISFMIGRSRVVINMIAWVDGNPCGFDNRSQNVGGLVESPLLKQLDRNGMRKNASTNFHEVVLRVMTYWRNAPL